MKIYPSRIRLFPRALSLCVVTVLGLMQARATTKDVAIQDDLFSPKQVTINVGDTVRWTNQGFGTHTATSGSHPPTKDGAFDSGNLSHGGTFSHTFTTADTFPYFCIYHYDFGMTGTVIVQAASNAPPTVSITSPTNGAVFAVLATVTIVADASDTDDTVAKVEFFAETNLLGAVTAAPYSLPVTNLTAGAHTLTARATDSRGAATTSAPVTITLNVPPTP